MSTAVNAWHFTADDCRLRYGDNRVVSVGVVVKVDCAPKLCSRGLHASIKLTDALAYAPGLTLHRVVVRGEVIHGDDKCVGTEREVTWTLPGARMSHLVVRYAQWCAKRAREYADAAYADAAARNAADAAAYAAAYDADAAYAAAYDADAAYADAAADAAYADAAAYAARNAADAAADAAYADAAARNADAAARNAERALQEQWWIDTLKSEGWNGE